APPVEHVARHNLEKVTAPEALLRPLDYRGVPPRGGYGGLRKPPMPGVPRVVPRASRARLRSVSRLAGMAGCRNPADGELVPVPDPLLAPAVKAPHPVP